MQVLDLRPPQITVKFSKGTTLNPVFFYLGKGNSVVDLTGFTAHFQARTTPASAETLLDLTTANGGLTIVTADAEDSKGNTIPNAQGIQLNIPGAATSLMTFKRAVFGLEVTSPSGVTVNLISGILEPVEEIVR